MSDETEEVREKIKKMHARLDELTYYKVLDLHPELDQAAIDERARPQFQKLVMEWHVDRYSSHDLEEEVKEKLQEIFSFINTAHQVVTDVDRRAEYDMELSGDDTDIEAVLTAESAFRRGQNMLDQGSYKGAHEQFRIACEHNPEELEYKAHHLYTVFLMIPKDNSGICEDMARGREIYQELDNILAEMPEQDWLLTFLGVVAKGINKLREAQTLFYEALTINPKNVTAQRQQRLIKMRKGQKKGFFAQLKEKIGLK